MYWFITVLCICAALLVQYLFSSRILQMKQSITIKKMALRDARAESELLEEQEIELKSSQISLTQDIRRFRQDIKALLPRLKKLDLDVPEPDFPLTEFEEDESPTANV
jgi:predicted Holliday junction resolvase-like endonuclease